VFRSRLAAPRAREGQNKPTDLHITFTTPHESAPHGSADASALTIRIAILLVDDHELLAHSVAVALGLDPELCVVAIETNPEAGLARVLSHGPDVVIFDRLSVATGLRQEHANSRLLALGAAEDPHVVRQCIRAGVDGCVNMNTSPSALGEMIKRIYHGEAVYETRALLELLRRPHPAIANSPRRTASLAKRELEVLSITAMGLNTAEAADYLGISINTLRTHLKNILAKLNARSKLEAVLVAIREGRIDVPEDSD